jgi:large subunit ribosomal protein L4e
MFAATKTYRKWHRKLSVNQKRYATVSAIAGTALPSLVLARGHKIDQVPEIPLVVADDVESINKTKQANALLKALGAFSDVEKVAESRKLRAGVGKMRNRRHVQRRGPLVVFNEDKGLTLAFRNLPGVDLCQVSRLNLLKLAPGGHLGRFVIWTQGAFNQLNSIWGSTTRESTEKKGYKLPRNVMSNSDITRIINSEEVQSNLRAANKRVKRASTKKNPLKNLGARVRLNPYALTLRRASILAQRKNCPDTQAVLAAARGEKKAKGEKKPKAPKTEKAPKAEKKVEEKPKVAKKAEEPAKKTEEKPKAKKAEEPKVASKKAEEPKVASKKAEEPKVASKKAEEPKVASKKAEEPKVASKKADEPKVASKKAEEPKTASKKAEEPKVASKKTEEKPAKASKKTEEKPAKASKKDDKPKSASKKPAKKSAAEDDDEDA